MIILDEDLTLPASNSTFVFENIVTPVNLSPKVASIFNPFPVHQTSMKRLEVPPLKMMNIKAQSN